MCVTLMNSGNSSQESFRHEIAFRATSNKIGHPLDPLDLDNIGISIEFLSGIQVQLRSLVLQLCFNLMLENYSLTGVHFLLGQKFLLRGKRDVSSYFLFFSMPKRAEIVKNPNAEVNFLKKAFLSMAFVGLFIALVVFVLDIFRDPKDVFLAEQNSFYNTYIDGCLHNAKSHVDYLHIVIVSLKQCADNNLTMTDKQMPRSVSPTSSVMIAKHASLNLTMCQTNDIYDCGCIATLFSGLIPMSDQFEIKGPQFNFTLPQLAYSVKFLVYDIRVTCIKLEFEMKSAKDFYGRLVAGISVIVAVLPFKDWLLK